MTDTPQQLAVKIALKKMFSQNWFDICTIDNCVKLSGSIPDSRIYQTMRTVHCVHYADMPADFRKWLHESVLEMFQLNGFDLSYFEPAKVVEEKIVIRMETEPKKKTGLAKLLNW